MTAWTEGRALGDARRAAAATAKSDKEAINQWVFENDAVSNADGSYTPRIGSETYTERRILDSQNEVWDQQDNAIAPAVKSSPEMIAKRRGQLKQLQNDGRKKIVEGGYSWAEDHMSSEEKERYLQDQKIVAQGQEIQKLNSRFSTSGSDNAVLDFMKNGDANVLQHAMNNDPNLRDAWREKGVDLVTNIDLDNDSHLLESIGLTQKAMDNPEVRKGVKHNLYKYHNGDKWVLGSTQQLAAETGMNRRQTQAQVNERVNQYSRFMAATEGVLVAVEEQNANTASQDANTNKTNAGTRVAELEETKKKNITDASDVDLQRELDKRKLAQQTINDAAARDTDATNAATRANELIESTDKRISDASLADLQRALDARKLEQQTTNDAATRKDDANATAVKKTEAENTAIKNQTERDALAQETIDDADQIKIKKEINRLKALEIQHEEDKLDHEIDAWKKGKPSDGKPSVNQEKLKAIADAEAKMLAANGVKTREELMALPVPKPGTNASIYTKDYIDLKNQYLSKHPSDVEKNTASYINQIAGLVGSAKNLSDQSTGIADHFIQKLGLFVKNDITGNEERITWDNIKAVFIKKDLGSQVTKSELPLMDKRFGKLSYKIVPVLQALKINTNRISSELETLQSNSPAVAGWFLHSKKEKMLKNAADFMNKRIDAILTGQQPYANVGGTLQFHNSKVGDMTPAEIIAWNKQKAVEYESANIETAKAAKRK